MSMRDLHDDGLSDMLVQKGRDVKREQARLKGCAEELADERLGLRAMFRDNEERTEDVFEKLSQINAILKPADPPTKPAPTKPVSKPKDPTTSSAPAPKPAPKKPKPKDPSTPSATATAVAINDGGFASRISTLGVAIFAAIAAFVATLMIWTLGIAPNAHGSAEWAGSPWAALLIAALVGGGVFLLVDRRNS